MSAILKLNADRRDARQRLRRLQPGPDSLSGFGRLDVGAALDALQSPAPDADRFEPNDDAGREAAVVYKSMSATATLDWWDDPNDVYRIHLVRGQRLSVLVAAGPEGRRVDRALEAGPPRARRRPLDLRAKRSVHPAGAPERIHFKAHRTPGTRCRCGSRGRARRAGPTAST